MFKHFYTTSTSTTAKQLERRFVRLAAGQKHLPRFMSAVTAAAVITAAAGATICAAAIDNEPENFFVNGKGYSIQPVLLENTLASHTDAYYVPLRDTFEALGYEVRYDADKTPYEAFIGDETFPTYEMPYDEDEQFYRDWLRSMVTNDAERYIYGATGRLNENMPLIEMVKGSTVEFCQIGSSRYSNNWWGGATILLDNTAYIPLRIVAYMVGGQDNVKWSEERETTYYEGALTFDEATMTINVTL